MIKWQKIRALLPGNKKEIFYPAWKKDEDVDSIRLAKLMAKSGSFSAGVATGVLLDLPNFILDELLQSNEVKVTGLGTFRLKIRGKAKEKKEDVTINGATIDMMFEPEKELLGYIRTNAQFKISKENENSSSNNSSTAIDASTGDYILDDPTIDTSTGGTTTTDTSTGTVDTSTGGNTNDGEDGLGG